MKNIKRDKNMVIEAEKLINEYYNNKYKHNIDTFLNICLILCSIVFILLCIEIFL